MESDTLYQFQPGQTFVGVVTARINSGKAT